jgi:hypothetical protein
MGVSKRVVRLDVNCFITTGQTGDFITCHQLSGINGIHGGYPTFGEFGTEPREGEFVFSNSFYPRGDAQFSYMLCTLDTQGTGFADNGAKPVACFDLNLPNNYNDQAWVVKNEVVAIGENKNGTKNEHFGYDTKVLIKASMFDDAYNITRSMSNIWLKTQNNFNVDVITIPSGIRFRYYDTPDTKMRWVSKIDIIQTIFDVDVGALTEQQIIDYVNSLRPAIGQASNAQNPNENPNLIILDGGEEGITLSNNLLDGGNVP